MGRLVINGDEIYELDEECLNEKRMQAEKERYRRIQKDREKKGKKSVLSDTGTDKVI